MKAKGFSDLLISGRFGNVIYYVRNGKQCVRRASMPGNKNKQGSEYKTIKQKAVINRFSIVQSAYSFFSKNISAQIWRTAAKGKGMTGQNLFNSLNSRCFSGDGQLVDYERFAFSQGELLLPRNMRLSREGDVFRVSWQEERDWVTAASTDRLWVGVIYDKIRLGLRLALEVSGVRGDLSGEFRLNTQYGENAHIYCFFEREDGSAFSECAYFRVESK